MDQHEKTSKQEDKDSKSNDKKVKTKSEDKFKNKKEEVILPGKSAVD